jgi:hypothetical protein
LQNTKKKFGGKKINLAKKFFNLAKNVGPFWKFGFEAFFYYFGQMVYFQSQTQEMKSIVATKDEFFYELHSIAGKNYGGTLTFASRILIIFGKWVIFSKLIAT